MDNLNQQTVKRCRTLVRKETEIAQECRNRAHTKLQILAEMHAAFIVLRKHQLSALIISIRFRVGV